jgi:hypothetical protein
MSIKHGKEAIMDLRKFLPLTILIFILSLSSLKAESVLDSVDLRKADGTQCKYLYSFNRNGCITSELYLEKFDGSWQNKTKHTYHYDAELNLLSDLTETWNGSQWINSWQESNTYENGNLMTHISETWNNSEWNNKWKSSYTYGDSGSVLTQIDQSGSGKIWTNFERLSYSYNADGTMAVKTSERWASDQWNPNYKYSYHWDSRKNLILLLIEAGKDGGWINSYRNIHNFDADNNNISSYNEKWENDNWVYSSMDTTSFNSNNKKVEDIHKVWENGAWKNDRRASCQYDKNGFLTEFLQEKWLKDRYGYYYWTNSNKSLMEHDKNGNITSELSQNWSVDYETWDNVSRLTSTYDNEDRMLSGHFERWTTDWVNADNSFFYYDTKGNFHSYYGSFITMHYGQITAINENNLSLTVFSLKQNYPNPFNPSTTIEYSIPNNDFVQIHIYNTLGQEVAALVNARQSAGYHKIRFDASDLPSGIYFYRLKSGSAAVSKRMLLLK